jgi:hypothetical protein
LPESDTQGSGFKGGIKVKNTAKMWALVDSNGKLRRWLSDDPRYNYQNLIYDTRRRAREVGKMSGLRVVRVTITREVKK